MASQRPYESEYKLSPGEDARLEVNEDNDLRCSCGNREFLITLPSAGGEVGSCGYCEPLIACVMCTQCGTLYNRRAIERARS